MRMSVLFTLITILVSAGAFLVDNTCTGRCGARFDSDRACQCNDQCTRYGDCCTDYRNTCTETSGQVTTDCSRYSSVSQVSQMLWDNDVNRLTGSDLRVNLQRNIQDGTRTDHATARLFTFVNETKLEGATYRTFIDLLDNYEPAKGDAEVVTGQESDEEVVFIEAILNTTVVQTLERHFRCVGKINSQDDMRALLTRVWFDLFSRSSRGQVNDTSAFEHIMEGEYKSSSTVNGFHNWISFYEKEKAGQLDYYGYVRKNKIDKDSDVVGAAFEWNGRVKTLGSFFLGVSPEFDISIYTLCFVSFPGSTCRVVLNSRPFEIKTYTSNGHMTTAFVLTR